MNKLIHSINSNILFVSNADYLKPNGGGVQWCTNEYLKMMEASNLNISICSYSSDMNLFSRVKRRLLPQPFKGIVPKSAISEIISITRARKISFIALNNTEACSLASQIREIDKQIKILFLSHGAEIVDLVNQIRIDPKSISRLKRSPHWIGRTLRDEIYQRQSLDGAICISKEDVQFERWLGSRNTLFIPRSIHINLLPNRAKKHRMGIVSTLDHVPNRSGIIELANAMTNSNIQIRLVGGPTSIGEKLASLFKSIYYCGRLSDSDLKIEASTWRAFANPIFCQARGASTKVATALGWGIPVLTTPQGARGYEWDTEALPLASSPKDLARLVQMVVSDNCRSTWRDRTLHVASLAPSIDAQASLFRDFLSKF
ncbi:hypothetical protein [Synechococcus sp. EJ6-Ellesmere]|uniref:hypothetical protein n=1 Tax=Synechococcus sp. EJ6-Ellesmere TaxID=2823734 RepID=UPI0020CB7532|nr:hypothetical protein [Synechococcus sp. EJ6-Ellesmere]MCP9826032.1 hypothetical protein [Synechococcus sp. EJ6-Ellesmere]